MEASPRRRAAQDFGRAVLSAGESAAGRYRVSACGKNELSPI
jgi:hypothetical protein